MDGIGWQVDKIKGLWCMIVGHRWGPCPKDWVVSPTFERNFHMCQRCGKMGAKP